LNQEVSFKKRSHACITVTVNTPLKRLFTCMHIKFKWSFTLETVWNKKLYINILIIIVLNSGLRIFFKLKAVDWWWWCQEQLAKKVDDHGPCQAQSPQCGAAYCGKSHHLSTESKERKQLNSKLLGKIFSSNSSFTALFYSTSPQNINFDKPFVNIIYKGFTELLGRSASVNLSLTPSQVVLCLLLFSILLL